MITGFLCRICSDEGIRKCRCAETRLLSKLMCLTRELGCLLTATTDRNDCTGHIRSGRRHQPCDSRGNLFGSPGPAHGNPRREAIEAVRRSSRGM